jgi:hypothetical protein
MQHLLILFFSVGNLGLALVRVSVHSSDQELIFSVCIHGPLDPEGGFVPGFPGSQDGDLVAQDEGVFHSLSGDLILV